MRRAEKQIASRAFIDQIMAQAQVCRLGLCKDNQPYIVPVAFGYDGSSLFFHTAPAGLKLDFIAANPRACFEVELDVKLLTNDSNPCQWSFSFSSVIGFGRIEEITDAPGKTAALDHIMRHYSARPWPIPPTAIEPLRVWRLLIEQITGKASKPKPQPGGLPEISRELSPRYPR